MTLITHGFNSDVDGWVSAMANAIASRGDLAIDQPRYTVDVTDPGHDDGPLSVVNTLQAGPSPTAPETDFPELVILLDWSDVAGTLPFGGYHRSTVDVAAAVSDALLTAGFLGGLPGSVAELPFHLIGHSRGASLVGELARQLGERGVWVDQVTTLDPHPVDGVREPAVPFDLEWGDAPMIPWDNVVYWDNYWRTQGDDALDFTGEPIANTHDVQLVESILTEGGYPFDHSNVHLWYYGTIDTSTDPPANNGDYDVPNDWYGGSHPSRTTSGYYFSRIVGGTRPGDGLSVDLRGDADRDAIDWDSAVWPNLINLQIDASDLQWTAGEPIPASYYYQDVDSDATVVFYLDADKNPYNGYGIEADQQLLARTGSVLVHGARDVATDTIPAGTYYLSARITDADGHTRCAYAGDAVTIEAATMATVVGQHVFYNNSFWDTATAENPDSDDEMAIAPDKTALRPAELATSDNYTSYVRGINGILVDIDAPAAVPTAADFRFKVGNDNDPAGWSPVTATPIVEVHPGEGAEDPDRVAIIWQDHAIENTWLEVTVLAANIALAEDYVFYFGNAIGETGDSDSHARVDANDVLRTRNNPHPFFDPAEIDSAYDFDRDERVDARDILIVRNSQTTSFNELKLIDLSGSKAKTVGLSCPPCAPDLSLDGPSEKSDRPADMDTLLLEPLRDRAEKRRGIRSQGSDLALRLILTDR
ncbi:MAG: hypothetical protein A2V70_01905 [Planctomycetes bacterium RBG_13_63_9]|nr:MAG: hypothetical protein A2V70_01905 [Planctomycetes bacterium RBG_13_63_9]